MSKRVAKLGLIIMFSHFFLTVIWAVPAQAESTKLPQLIRLHVLANSETLEDQRIKLTVRDELLAVVNPLLSSVSSMAEAEAIIKANLGLLSQTVAEALVQADATYESQLQFGLFNFPAKYYGLLTLPAGRYMALNVTLGEGVGRNWWCVVFPTMCFTAGVCEQAAESEEQQAYHLRSKIVEWVERLLSWCSRLKS